MGDLSVVSAGGESGSSVPVCCGEWEPSFSVCGSPPVNKHAPSFHSSQGENLFEIYRTSGSPEEINRLKRALSTGMLPFPSVQSLGCLGIQRQGLYKHDGGYVL